MSTTVTVSAPAASIRSFVAEPAQVNVGGEVTLRWETLNADSVSISGVTGALAANGSIVVRPAQTTDYLLSANAAGTSVTSAVRVTVLQPAAITLFKVEPASVQKGSSATLTWQVQNATRVTINGIEKPLAGSESVAPNATTIYTLSAIGENNEPKTGQAVVVVRSGAAGVTAINHILFMFQENRSFDHYFGRLNLYRAKLGLSPDVDGYPPDASNPSYDESYIVKPFHLGTVCTQNQSPSWNESHVQRNRNSPQKGPALMNGFVRIAAANSREKFQTDDEGLRGIGYYDERDIPYYYFMASMFATSDRWFAPLMANSQPNRLYTLAATSAGHVKPNEENISRKTIFHLLEEANISWKVYTTDRTSTGNGVTYLNSFFPFAGDHRDKVVPLAEYYEDLKNGALPAVALIEGGYNSQLDEHPNNNVQLGVAHVANILNGLMVSSAWKDSVFFLTYDEPGGLYDHVPPIDPAVHPDGVAPIDLNATDLRGDFNRSGFRVPLIVVSPFAKKHFVSHTPADTTAILKFIQLRHGLPPLTNRDAAQPDMLEFFDFDDPSWLSPPAPPAQPTDGVCNMRRIVDPVQP